MGLDVYLQKCPDLAAAEAAQKKASEEVQAVWEATGKSYDDMSGEEREVARRRGKEINKENGCDDDGRHLSIENVEAVESKIDPEHMFKVGYFRSSYNGSGFERVMKRIGLPTLHDIFDNDQGEDVCPDWDVALVNVNRAIVGYKAHLDSPMGKFSVSEIRPIWDQGVANEQEALAAFAAQLATERGPDWDCYCNGIGEFMISGLKVHAIITKKYEQTKSANPILHILNTPSVFMIYEKAPLPAGKEDWYLTALRIVRETIDFVLAQPDPKSYYLAWSA